MTPGTLRIIGHVKDPRVRVRVQQAADHAEPRISLLAAYTLLKFHGDDGPFHHHVERMLSGSTAMRTRWTLVDLIPAFFIEDRPQPVVDALIQLLSDADVGVRYRGHHRLRQETGITFGYAYRLTPRENAKALGRWRAWRLGNGLKWRRNPDWQERMSEKLGLQVELAKNGELRISSVCRIPRRRWRGLRRATGFSRLTGILPQGKALADVMSLELAPDAVGGSVALDLRTVDGRRRLAVVRRSRLVVTAPDGDR